MPHIRPLLRSRRCNRDAIEALRVPSRGIAISCLFIKTYVECSFPGLAVIPSKSKHFSAVEEDVPVDWLFVELICRSRKYLIFISLRKITVFR